jgi:hypothetical protein
MVIMVIMAIVPIVPMIIGRTMLIAWPRIDAEYPIDAAHSAADRAANNTANWTSGITPFRRAALHAPENALRVNRD